jgi:hypothetical protein
MTLKEKAILNNIKKLSKTLGKEIKSLEEQGIKTSVEYNNVTNKDYVVFKKI